MQMPGKIGTLFFFVVVASSFVLLAEATGETKNKKCTLVKGTGNFVTQVTRTAEPLDPPCVALVTRVGNVSFSGLIENTLENGHQETHALQDGCADPVQGTTATTYILKEATVAGRKGCLILKATGVFEGDATLPAGSRNRLHFKIRGVSGDLKGATGTGQFVGQSTTTSSSSTYYAEILLPN
ncbi:MAG: hypothetical protein U0586_01565 [Candidatus Brocadiaceae bacterium]